MNAKCCYKNEKIKPASREADFLAKYFLGSFSGLFICFTYCVFLFLFSCPVFFISPAFSADFNQLIDNYCLTLSYANLNSGQGNGNYISDNRARIDIREIKGGEDDLNGSLLGSMAAEYPLEPLRPEMKAGYNPGRKRPYAFLEKIYGRDAKEVRQNLREIKFLNKTFTLAGQAAASFKNFSRELEKLAEKSASMKKFLEPEGGFYWRKIAGEKHLSAHSYGIAIDIGVNASPYWRWSKKMPHPLQKDYPADIVALFENNGFIWGGKWQRYDLMHYEYRPELICKAKMLDFQKRPFKRPLKLSSRH